MTDIMNPLNLVFMGSPNFAVPTLNALIDAGHRIKCVYTQKPRPAGRGQQKRYSPVHVRASKLQLEVRTPINFQNQADRSEFASLGADVAIVAAYGLILPADLLAAPKFGCVNVHASLLPRWRGAAPIQRAIMAGDAYTGVSIMAMEEALDTGPIYASKKVEITAKTTAQSLHDILASMGGPMMAKVLSRIVCGRAKPTPQPEMGVTYANKIDKDEGRIDWTKMSLDIERQIRGLNPWPGVWFVHNGQRIKVLAAHRDNSEGQAGTIIKAPLYVACGEGSLCIDRLQRPGKAPMDVKEYLRGNPIAVGSLLG